MYLFVSAFNEAEYMRILILMPEKETPGAANAEPGEEVI